MKHLDLFSGIGGFALAAQWAGMQTAGFSEVEPFCCKLLEKRFPGVPNYGDIKKYEEWEIEEQIDIITGGFPCQPASQAGKRRGTEDDRWLWEYIIGAIRRFKPGKLLLENVIGLANLGELGGDFKVESKVLQRLEESDLYQKIFSRQEILLLARIIGDLEKAGYKLPETREGIPIVLIIPACAKNAPHRRDRVWIIAYSHSRRLERTKEKRRNGINVIGENSTAPNTDINRSTPRLPRPIKRDEGFSGKFNNSREEQNRWETSWHEIATRFCRVDARLPKRLDKSGGQVNRLRGLGNAIVPQIAYEILKGIAEGR